MGQFVINILTLEKNAARVEELEKERAELSERYEAVLAESRVGAGELKRAEDDYAAVDTLIREALGAVSEAKNRLVDFATKRARSSLSRSVTA